MAFSHTCISTVTAVFTHTYAIVHWLFTAIFTHMVYWLPTGYILQKESRERSHKTKHLGESTNKKTDSEENHEVFLSVQDTRITTEPPQTRGAAHCRPHHPGDPWRTRGGALRLSPALRTQTKCSAHRRGQSHVPPHSAAPCPGPAALTRRQRPRRCRDSAGRKRGAEPEPAQRAAPPRQPTWRAGGRVFR